MSDPNVQAGFVAPDPAELNKLFPGYEIEGLIATGGMGAVYCAVQKSLDRTVALKILPHEFSKDAAFCAGFEAEAKAMARLNHPNLIGVYDFGEVNGMLFIIMEYVAGKSIYHSAHGRAIDPAEVIRLVTGVCHGLAHAHENGIIHRDIKPSNILLDLNAQPKIGDFGLARPIERKVEEGEEIFGTPGYTAPEVVNTPNAVDFRADIFSVGVLLHELLTGKLPADDRRPPSVISHCDPRFDVVVRRATHVSPAGRYASAAEMAKDLAIIATSSGPRVLRAGAPAAPGHAGPRVARPLQPRRPVKVRKSSNSSFFIMLLVLVGLGFGAYYYFTQSPGPEKRPIPSVPPPPDPVPAVKHLEPPVDPDTDSQAAPDPEPAPIPTPQSSPEPAAEPAAQPETEAATDERPQALPKFDVAALFARARKIMQDRAKPLLTERKSSLAFNFDDFEKALRRQVRKVDQDRETIGKVLDRDLSQWKEGGSLIPGKAAEDLSAVPDIDAVFSIFLDKQATIESAFQKSLVTLAGTYTAGMQLQIDRLKTENDAPAVKLIEEEISRTKQSPKYFSDLMLGIDPTIDGPLDGAE